MASYKLYESYSSIGSGPSPLIVLPLAVVTLFCFGFILIQTPAKLKETGHATASASPQTESLTREAKPPLPAIPFASQSTLLQLSSEPVNTVSLPDPMSSTLQAAIPITTSEKAKSYNANRFLNNFNKNSSEKH